MGCGSFTRTALTCATPSTTGWRRCRRGDGRRRDRARPGLKICQIAFGFSSLTPMKTRLLWVAVVLAACAGFYFAMVKPALEPVPMARIEDLKKLRPPPQLPPP